MEDFFKQGTPEDMGIRSADIKAFLDELEEKHIIMHSMMLVRGGKVLAETYYKPYTSTDLQRMFSVSKSFTGIAIGFLADEKKLDLDDPITKYFPEKIPEGGVHPFTEQITIRHMLTMTTAHERTTFGGAKGKDWMGSYFTVTPTHLPGTVFSYESSASCVLAALVERMTGLTLLDYLRSRFLDAIGFSKNAYCMQTPDGYSHGAAGLMCTTYDLAKVAWILMHAGAWQGVQYIPRWYAKEAVQRHSDNVVKGQTLEEQQGYGYQLWMTRHDGFVFYGLGGQLALCLPKEDLMLITTADTTEYPEGTQAIYDAFWRNIYANLDGDISISDSTAADGAAAAGRVAVTDRDIAPVKDASPSASVSADREADRTVKTSLIDYLAAREVPHEALTCVPEIDDECLKHWYACGKNGLGLNRLRLTLSGDTGVLELERDGGCEALQFGIGHLMCGSFLGKDIQASGTYRDDNSFFIRCRISGEYIGTLLLILVWKNGSMTLLGNSFGDARDFHLSGAASGYSADSSEADGHRLE